MSSGIYIYISTIIPLHQLSRYGPGYAYIWERHGKPTELEGREPSINTPPHLSRHPKRIHKKERFCVKEHWERVRGCDRFPGREEPHKLRGSMKKCAKPPSTVISAISKSPLISTTAPAFTVLLKLTKSTYCDLEEARYQS